MTRDQPVWLLKIGKILRERGERTASLGLPKTLQEALERLAASERQREKEDRHPRHPRRRIG
jgi:hypothetical protein